MSQGPCLDDEGFQLLLAIGNSSLGAEVQKQQDPASLSILWNVVDYLQSHMRNIVVFT